MDKLDVAIIRRLFADSRTPYATLAEGLGISVQATQKRVEAMIRSGVIKRFTARLSYRATGGMVTALASGRSTEGNLGDLVARLEAVDQVRTLLVSSGNNLHIELDLKSIGELGPLRSTLMDEARMTDVSMAVIPCDTTFRWPANPIRMRPLDLRIIQAMRDNSRQPLAQVAEEVGVTTKTVCRSLEKMRREGSVRMSIEWVPDQPNAIMSIVHIGTDRRFGPQHAGASLFNSCPHMIYPLPFSNMRGQMACIMWARSMAEMKESLDQLSGHRGVVSVLPYVIHYCVYFPTWRDSLLDELVMKKAPLEVAMARHDPRGASLPT